jgi:hypothetical protein
MLMISSATANELVDAWKAKDYMRVSDIYRNDMKKDYSHKELIIISYSLRKLKFFRQDIKLNVRIVKKKYGEYHKRLLAAIKNADTIDADEYPKSLFVHYWNLFTSYGQIIKGYSEDSPLVEKDNKYFLLFSKILSEVEFREARVDKYNDMIIAHRQYLINKIYRLKLSFTFQYVSWQQEGSLVSSTIPKTGLILTNRGFCTGGDIGYENYLYHFYFDGCFLYGVGGVKNTKSSAVADYKQSGVPAYGVKVGPGASLIVSSSKSRIGIKIPIIYSIQKLTQPTGANFTVEQESPVSVMTTLYSRWQFEKWYFQTEFGKYLMKEQTFWGLGIGKEF